ncbi:MAG: ATP-binding cassette domain-containing protein [Alphaproteobacteria bacterium]|nr:ATP-binding cassette domain-containing protein [Alphaproteobacteria bacterium]
MFLSLSNIAKRFGTVTALNGVSLDIAEGEFVCFLGPSGCGKTTLLRVIGGLESADAGEVKLNGRSLTETPARLRNFGVVFQSYSLFPSMSVAKNVAYGLECAKWAKPDIHRRVAEMLALVHLGDQAEKYPHQLSGGQQQRVALARALAPNPTVLLLDEPLSALDAKVREDLRAEIKDLQSALGVTTVMVTHDQHEAMEIADRIVVMNGGVIEQIGGAVDLYERPVNRFVAEFIGRMNLLSWPPVADRGTSSLRIGVRPEHIELVASGGDASNSVVGRIEKCVFLGSFTRVTLAVGNERLQLELRGRRTDLGPGGSLTVRIPPDAVHRIGDVTR